MVEASGLRSRRSLTAVSVVIVACLSLGERARADEIHLEGVVPNGPETHFFLAFEVPEGIVEIEVQHDDLSEDNILDWGLQNPDGYRGWGGGNTEPAVVGTEAASRSYVPGPIPAGTWEVVVGKAKLIEEPARYSVDIFLRTEPTLSPQGRLPYQDPGVLSPEAGWYAGDFHVHSNESGDSEAGLEEVLAFAESVGVDFIVLSEHNTHSGLTTYRDAQARHPDLLIIPGVEFTTYRGHANGLGATDWVDHRIGVRGATIDAAIEAYHEQGALFSINHPEVDLGALCIGCGWDHEVDPTTIDAVEVQSGVFLGVEFWESLCAAGAHAAALGGSDDHRAGRNLNVVQRPIGTPLTMVYADELSVQGILDGVRGGRTAVKLNGAGDPMLETTLSGPRVQATVYANTATLTAVVSGGEGHTLRVIRNGEVIEEVEVVGDPFTHDTEVQAPADGEDRYRHQVALGFTPRTIGSYVWLRKASDLPADAQTEASSGCGCAVGRSATATHGLAALPFLLLLLVRRRLLLRLDPSLVQDDGHVVGELAG